MILRTANGGVYAVHFTHIHYDEPVKIGNLPTKHQTVCTVHEGFCEKKIRPCTTEGRITADACCSLKDVFEKAKGRKLSFTRAIQVYPRVLRAQLWEAYLHGDRRANTTSLGTLVGE